MIDIAIAIGLAVISLIAAMFIIRLPDEEE